MSWGDRAYHKLLCNNAVKWDLHTGLALVEFRLTHESHSKEHESSSLRAHPFLGSDKGSLVALTHASPHVTNSVWFSHFNGNRYTVFRKDERNTFTIGKSSGDTFTRQI